MPKDDVIGRLEAATGPCRELDARIWCHLNGKKYLGHNTPYGEREGRFVQVEYTSPPKRSRQITNFPKTPHALCVTASIDAAITMVDTCGGWFELSQSLNGGSARITFGTGHTVFGEGKTPALAICIAALRATERGEAGR